MNFKFATLPEEYVSEKILKCDSLSNDMIFMKYDVNIDDVIVVKENEYAVLIEKGMVYDVKSEPGRFIILNEIIDSDIDIKDNWKDLKIRKSDDNTLCVVFLNKNLIKHNKYYINDPIKYKSWNEKDYYEMYIKLEGSYDFFIQDPKKMLSKVIGLRNHYSKQELIERIRKYVISSIEKGINELSEEYKLDIETLTQKSKELEIKLKQNEYDNKLLEYGVKITYFDIESFELAKKKFKIF